jgi:hypothetical protein
MDAAEVRAFLLDAVTDHLAAAVTAHGRQRLDRALEGVEDVRRAVHRDREGLVVVVPANFADLLHDDPSPTSPSRIPANREGRK